jgi:S-formylglutathione hydrolase FrmB
VASGDGRPPGGGRRDGTEVIVGRESRAFAACLRRLGIPFRADLYRGGRHDWPYWERDLEHSLPVLLGTGPATGP